MASPTGSKTTVVDVLEVLFRHKWKSVSIPLVVLTLGTGIILFAPREYMSEAKLALQVGRQSVALDPTAQTGQQIVGIQQMGRDFEVVSALDMLRSRELSSKVVDRMGVDFILRGGPQGAEKAPHPFVAAVAGTVDATVGAAARNAIAALKSIDPISDREEAIIEVERSLIADAERDSVLLLVRYTSPSPEGARQVLDAVIDIYRQEHLRINRNKDSRAFFEKQQELARTDLDATLEKVRKLKDEIGVASIDSRRGNLESQLQSVTMASFAAASERSEAIASLDDLRGKVGEMPERLISSKKQVPNEGADLMREQLYALQVRQADLKARYSESHPLVVAISRQVGEAERVVTVQHASREETTDDVNPIHRELTLAIQQKEAVVAGLDARLKTLAAQLSVVRGDLEQMNDDSMHLTQLEREVDILNRKYVRYSEGLEQTRIDEELEDQQVSSISIAQAPTLSEKPVSPSKVVVGMGSIVFAVAGTLATILGFEQLSDKLRGESAVAEAVGAPVLGSTAESSTYGRILV
ncbi:MAG: GumC family protein [Lacipirellulaceae bacterium]